MQDRFKFRLIIEQNYKTINGTFKGTQIYYCNGFLQGKTKTLFFGNGKRYSFLNSQIKHINQCTGLKDKNDKLIYEGDIVKYMYYNPKRYTKWAVVFDQNTLEFGLKDSYCGYLRITRHSILNNKVEVIGNIYENPELIGGAEC